MAHYVQNIGLFTFLALLMALIEGTTGFGKHEIS